MSLLEHPDHKEELERLTYTIDYIKKYYAFIIERKKSIDNSVEYGVSHFNSDNAEQFNELILNTSVQETLNQKIKDLEKSMDKPYFTRVDFIENNEDDLQKLYIGKTSLLREEDHKFLIIDWRAPIANLYYEGRLGKASYMCPDGNIQGEITLKRQYIIEKAELKELYDIDITTNDEFLQASLGSSKDSRLKDIVSTIQAEQNKVIRAPMWNPLIVQGAAGGGKTTIALHRIAYLLYTYEKSFTADNFMIIAPNRFFLSYISEVLPELGVENVRQSTFEDFAIEVIGKKLMLKDSYEKLANITNLDRNSNNNIELIKRIQQVSKFKSSLLYKEIIKAYLKSIERDFIPQEDFKIHTFTLMTYKDIKKLFLKEYKSLPFMKRINEIKKHLCNALNRKKDDILNSIEKDYDFKLDHIRYTMEDSDHRRKEITNLIDERDALLQKTKNNTKTLVKEYLNKIKPLTPMQYYKNFFQNEEELFNIADIFVKDETKKASVRDFMKKVREDSLNVLKETYVELEDLAPLMYIKYTVYGLQEKINLRHIIIDEAQDFSLFQFYILKEILNSSSMTILGDLCQGIYSYRGITDWQDILDYIFKDNSPKKLTLEQSYRTTVEIMNGANNVIDFLQDSRLPKAKPVIRHGENIKICEMESLKEIAIDIVNKIEIVEKEGFKSAAIICKTLKECNKLKDLLKALNHPIKVITGKEKEYPGGMVLIPSYLVKGLEFDMVIITNASKSMYTAEELDVKLLYVAMTRPLHKLYIYSIGERATMLKGI